MHKWLEEEADLRLGLTSLTSYISRIRRREAATKRGSEAAAVLRWPYWKARRYFRQVEGICVSYQPKRYKRPYRTFTIPLSVFTREWQKMTGREPESTEIIHRRIALAGQK